MSGASIEEFIAYWEDEGASYVRRGDYQWMASLVPGQRVLEIGCGVGYATQALLSRGLTVCALESLPECLAVTQARVGAAENLSLKAANVFEIGTGLHAELVAFAPDTVVCWLMGAPAETIGAGLTEAGEAVAAYRERVHRAVAELSASLPSVRHLHYVDRTAIPWQAKDIGRDTLVRYHQGKTLLDLPFVGSREQALYRRLGDNVIDLAQVRQRHASLKSVVPTLASLLVERRN